MRRQRGWLGTPLVELVACDSTNDEAAALAAAGAPHGAVVVAAAQRRGRGRLGRSWYSPPGESLYLSCLLRPQLTPAAVPPITLAAGVAVAEAVAALGLGPRLKWPNDVLVGGRKLAGVLTEMTTRGGQVDTAVVGVGVNVNARSFPPELAGRATSLAIELGRSVDLIALRSELLAQLDIWLGRFLADGLTEVGPAWTRWSGVGGQRVRVELGGGAAVEGRVRGITPDGALDLEDDRGHHVRIVAGEVVLLDPPAGG